MTNFAQARRFIEAIPPAELAANTDLAQAAEHLKDALTYVDMVQGQKAAAYVSAAKIDRLQDHRLTELAGTLSKSPWPGSIPIFTSPRPSSDFVVAVKDFATVYLTDLRETPAACASPEHHRAVCDLFAAIELEERRAA